MEEPTASESVVIAEIHRPLGDRSYRHIYTALAPPEYADAILTTPGGIGHEVRATGPRPTVSPSVEDRHYTPRFYVNGGGFAPHGLEPLSVAWTSANRSYIAPDQGFLMTYGLIPRLVSSKAGDEIHWDDPSLPKHDVVVVSPVSIYDYPSLTIARVRVQRDYLQDYATIRGLHLIQVYFAECWQDPPSDMESVILSHGRGDIVLPGRLIRLYKQKDPASYLAQVWGTRALMAPTVSPVTEGRREYGGLEWPGIAGIVTHDRAMESALQVAFVFDNVLERFEGRPEYSIHPESGGVSYGSQWTTGNTHRVGRDLIAVELKKLYEGTPPEIVNHYHLHAAPPPTGDRAKLRDEPNIGTRTRRIVYALAEVGEGLARLSSILLGKTISSNDTVGLSKEVMDYEGWWLAPQAEPVSRHAPRSMTFDQFLSRCEGLDQMVIEALKEAVLRETLVKLGVEKEAIVKFKSRKLLVQLLSLATVAAQSHLRIAEDAREILARHVEALAEGQPVVDLPVLFHLHELRTIRSHRTETSRKGRVSDALGALGVDERSTAEGWGLALDALYDGTSTELESAGSLIRGALAGQS